ncbi:hypothetical protein BCH_03099 [Brucella sp. 191011898]|nr:hypothetical protein BCH_03099 [Brucella sp. 191011898]
MEKKEKADSPPPFWIDEYVLSMQVTKCPWTPPEILL